MEQRAQPPGQELVRRQIRQLQVPDGHTQGLVGLVCLGELVMERAAVAQHHIPRRYLVPAEIHGVVAAALQDQQHLRQILVAVHQRGVLTLCPVVIADVGHIGAIRRERLRLLPGEYHPLPIQFHRFSPLSAKKCGPRLCPGPPPGISAKKSGPLRSHYGGTEHACQGPASPGLRSRTWLFPFRFRCGMIAAVRRSVPPRQGAFPLPWKAG